MSDFQVETLGKRYAVLGALGQGGMGAVYLVQDRLMNRQVALKRVNLPTVKGSAPTVRASRAGLPTVDSLATEAKRETNPEIRAAPGGEPVVVVQSEEAMSQDRLIELRLALANEFHTLASLRHPNIVSVLDYGFAEDGQPYFTMEVLAQAQSLHAVSGARPLPTKLGLLLQVLQALSYLHRRGVLHRDLKPANILCVQTAAGPRVKLLDFGLAQLRKRQRLAPEEISGTLGYIAPEVLRGHQVTPQADLYSFGVLAFELLAGRSLFDATDATGLVAEALRSTPPVDDASLPLPLQAVLRQLLAPEPADRFATALAAARALAESVGIPPPAESAELRDCVLGSAEFVGRDAELAVLTTALQAALRGRGQLILLAGESGIGKSRLIDELRTLALVEGACVLQVQASSDGNTDLGVFADALRRLCLYDPPAPPTASVLKGIIADLPTLLQREILDPAEIDTQAARQRLMGAIKSTLLGCQRPTLLLLEDLHWAGPDSLEVLRQLSGQLADWPLLLVGTYRSEERPELPGELPGSQLIQLSRLQRDDMARLSASILGEGRASAHFLDWLSAESEGNSFFITEAMRAVAEEAGSLEAVGEAPLPQGILTGGMDAVLRRRLARVPPWGQPLLQCAAIAGRQVSVELLRTFDANVEDWLRACAAAGVLEVHQPSWRFCHDKLRERLLADIPQAQQRSLHLQVAEALERIHVQPAEAAATLAFHYEQAAHLPKAATYAVAAGEGALRRGALAEALSFLQKASVLQNRLGVSALDRAPVQKMLAETYYGLSQFEAGLAAAAQALAMLGRPVPDGQPAIRWALVQQAGIQLLRKWRPPTASPPLTSQEVQLMKDETWLHILNIDMSGYLGRAEGALYSILYLANLGDRHPELQRSFPFRLGLELLLSLSPLPRTAEGQLDALVAALPQITDTKMRLLISRTGGAIYHYQGKQQAARSLLNQALALADDLADTITQRQVLSYLVRTTVYLGDYAASLQCARRLFALGQSAAEVRWHHYGRVMLGLTHLCYGQIAEARAYLFDDQLQLPKDLACMAAGARALYLARVGRTGEAHHQLEQAIRGCQQEPINILLGVDSYRILGESALLLLERARTDGERRAAAALCRPAIGILRSFALRSPHGRAELCLQEGRLALMQGRARLAAWLFGRAHSLAGPYQMGPTAALSLCWRGRAKSGAAGRHLIHQGLAQLRQFGPCWEVDEISGWPV
ncbi:MAG TPA: protein kinase [Pseudomonadota bacterium]|nr:protein kinase [Pseudomonadota bacterium]